MADTLIVDFNDELPIRKDVRVRLGDTFRYPFTLQVNLTGTVAALVLTGVTWELRVSTERGGTSKLSETTTADWTHSGVHVDTAASGQATINGLAADLAGLGEGVWWWDVRATFPSNHTQLPSVVKTLWEGAFTVWQDSVV